jgi:hypothetical protein
MKPYYRRAVRAVWILVGAVLFSAGARAQLIDSVEVTRDGANAVVRIHFAAMIQYLRHAPANEGKLIQVFFQITAGDEAALEVREDQRRPPPNDLLPPLTVTYPRQNPSVQRRIDVEFAAPVTFRLRPEDNSTIMIIVPLSDEKLASLVPRRPQGIAVPAPAVPSTPLTELDRGADGFMQEARRALGAGEFESAAVALNRVLNLPPNVFSQEAQELIGLAREQLGETTKAKAEFDLYLKLYPDGPGADRVRKRLAALATAAPVAGGPRPGQTPQRTTWGSLSQYYYGGASRADTTITTVTPATNATTIDTQTLSGIDQSQLVNNVDLTTRYRDSTWDNRAVVRDQYTANFLGGQSNENRLTALFAEMKHQPSQLFMRLGRQSATSGGVIGRFDGGVLSWGVSPNFRANAVAGQPVDDSFGLSKTFYGASADIESLASRWSGNLFVIRQKVLSTEDRTGIGGELRYFDTDRNVYTLLDYDPTFKATNIAMAQGNWQFAPGTTLNALFDYRRSPTLQLTNALIADPTVSLDTMLAVRGLDSTRALAKALTPISRVMLLGITQQINPIWQLGFDFRISSLTGTPAAGTMPEVASTGNVYTYTAQAIGTNLTAMQDILVVNGSILTGSQYDAQQLSFDYRFTVWQYLMVEPMLKYYHQTGAQDMRLTRWTPGLKAAYRVRERFSVEAEVDFEISKTRSPVIVDDVTRHFYYVGWRWDL